jgi:hypothetical protein
MYLNMRVVLGRYKGQANTNNYISNCKSEARCSNWLQGELGGHKKEKVSATFDDE